MEASAVILESEEPTVAPIIPEEIDEVIEPADFARTFKADGLDDELAAMFAEFESDSDDFLFDFVPSDAQFELMNEEEDAPLSFTNTTTTDTPTTIAAQADDASLEVQVEDAPLDNTLTITENNDLDKDGNTDADLDYFNIAPTFTLKGNFSEIVDSLIRRYGQPVNDTENEKLSQAISASEETIVSEFDQSLNMFQRSIASALSSRTITINGEEVIFARSSFQVK